MSPIRPFQSSAVLAARPRFQGNPLAGQNAPLRVGSLRRKTIAARMAISLSVVSCIQLFLQDNLGLSQFDYTQAIIKLSSLGLGLVMSMYVLSVGGFRRRLGRGDVLFSIFILSSLLWSWRSWSPRLSVGYLICYVIAVFNVRIALDAVGVRETFVTLYWVTCSVVIASLIVSVILPQQFPLFSLDSLGRRRLSLFKIHPIQVADMMVLNLIVGRFLKVRFRLIGQALCATILLCTASRASVVGGVAILAMSAFQTTRGKWRGILRGAAILGALALVAWLVIDPASFAGALFPTANTDMLVAESIGDSGLNGRLPLWIKLIQGMSLDNMMGYGFQGYREIVFNLSGWAAHAHNSILDGILSSGYIGGAALIAYMLYGLLRSRRGFQPVPVALCKCLIWYALFDGMMGPTWLDPFHMMYLSAAIYLTQGVVGSRNRYQRATLPSAGAVLPRAYSPA